MENDFADNRIMVVLSNEASLAYLEAETFTTPELKVGRIESFTSPRGKEIKAMVDERKSTSLMEKLFTSDPNAEEISSYREVLCIELEERGKDKVLEAIALLEQREDVLYVGPDYVITGCADETSSSPQLDYLNQTETIDLPAAMAMVTNPKTVRVAVLDTGIDASHEALSDIVNGDRCKNYVDYENHGLLSDPHGHGTHVAGIIAATAINVELISLRVLDSYKDGYSSYAAAAIKQVNDWWDEGFIIPIINFSICWQYNGGNSRYDVALNEVIQQYRGLFVCGAGNEHKYIREDGNSADNVDDSVLVYPASYNFGGINNMIVVGASNQADNGLWIGTIDPGSNYGQLTVDIFAPGDTILSCYPSALCVNCFKEDGSLKDSNHVEMGYHYMSGTSMATPYVTGVAALIMSIHPSKSAADIKALILNNDDNQSWLTGNCASGGRLNAYKALNASHTFGEYVSMNANYHYRTCTECTYTDTTAHAFGTWKTDVYGCKSRTCADCGYSEKQHLKSSVIVQKDSSTHVILYPCCNTGTSVSHTWGGWANYNALNHRRKCADCGYEQLQKHNYLSGDTTKTCTVCYRSEIVPGEGILSIHSGEELAE